MTMMLELKEKLKAAYAKQTIYVDIVLKALLAFICFYWISVAFATDSVFSNVFIMLIAALLCLLFLFLRFVPDDSLGLILMPIGMYFGMPALIPICFGLRRRPVSLVAVGSGCVTYYMIDSLTRNKDQLATLEQTEYMERLTLLLGGLVSDSGMVVNLLAISAVIVIVYAIRRLGFAHSFTVATLVGAVTYVFFIMLGNAVVETHFNVSMIMIGAMFTVVIALIVQFFFLSVDYSRTETMEFEDDDYYYYVKAVPKQYAYKNRVREIESVNQYRDLDEIDNGQETQVESSDVDFEQRLEESLRNL